MIIFKVLVSFLGILKSLDFFVSSSGLIRFKMFGNVWKGRLELNQEFKPTYHLEPVIFPSGFFNTLADPEYFDLGFDPLPI